MTDLITFKADATALNQRLQLFAKAAGISLRQAVEYQFGLLTRDIVVHLSPRNRAAAQKSAVKDVAGVFRRRPREIFLKRQRGKGSTTWLYASPSHLVGVNTADFQPDMSESGIVETFYAQKSLHRGPAWSDKGLLTFVRKRKEIGGFAKSKRKRGVTDFQEIDTNQKVMILNRIVVRVGTLRKLIRRIRERHGLLKASFAVGWRQLKIRSRLPSWVEKHVSSGRARGVLVNGLATPGKPHLKLISRATGCEKTKSVKAIRSALRRRIGAMKTDIRLYVQGIKKQSGLKSAQTLPAPNFNAAVFDAISE